jgi:SAM-dependent methyltransferase
VGLHSHSMAFLVASRGAGVDFDRTLTLGRQHVIGDARDVRSAFAEAGSPISREDARRILLADDGYAGELLRQLGARHVDSVDASGYERSTLIHDLNEPFPKEWHGRYSAVIDGGTLEHVFNFPVALASALSAVRPGGHYIAFTPADNQPGHGFYQFGPELYHRVLGAENGFEVRCMLMRGHHTGARWFSVPDPATLGRRAMAFSSQPVDLYVLARRTEEREVLAEPPQQSDYVAVWQRHEEGIPAPGLVRRAAHRVRRLEPHASMRLRLTVGRAIRRRSRRDFPRVRLRDVPPFDGGPSR